VRNRLAVYHKQTAPLINYYKNAAQLENHAVPVYIRVNGMDTVDAVKNEIFSQLDKHREEELLRGVK
jgi:adenylate kinase